MKERGISAEEFRAPIPAGLPGNAGLPSALAFEPMKTPGLFCFGHRGARGHEPENTLRSVRKALELGADGIEVDVYLADGQLVVIHDDTLERTTNGAGRVAGKSFAYLRSLDAGHGEPIPTLAEVFDTVNRRAVINVELKGPGTAAPVAQLIGQYVQSGGWRHQDFLVSSFDLAQIQAIKRLQPGIRTGALIEKVPPGLAAFAEQLGAWSVHPGKRCVSPELVADAHRRGLKVFVFTINRPAEIAFMQSLGVDGVFTDYPERVVTFSTRKK
ncbi:MAG: glycerophosphodiester phosphodiesterase family protein [Verrucomicrobiota bacterium]